MSETQPLPARPRRCYTAFPMETTPAAPPRQTTDTSLAPPTPTAGEAGRKLYSAAAVVGLAFVISRALGLVRTIVIGARFGTSPEYAAYVAAFRIPDFIFLMVMSGAFGSAFVPVFAGFLGQGHVRKAWRLAANVLTLMVEGFFLVAILAFILADPLMRLLAPGLFAPDVPPEIPELAVRLTRILLLSPLFLGLGAAAKSLLEAHDNFALPAFAPVTYNVAVVLGALFLAPRYGVEGLAWGVVAASAGHLLTQLPGLVRVGLRYWFLPKPVAEGVGDVGRLLGPRIIGQAAFQINFTLVVTTFATILGPAYSAALDYAYQLMQLPHGLFAIAVSTVIFPAMARQWAVRDHAALKATLGDAIRPLLFLTLPAATALILLARPIVQTILQWGEFEAESTELVAAALPAFAAGLVALAIVETVTRAFYAMHDTRTPLVASLLTIGVNIAAAFALTWGLGFGHRALAASMSATVTLEALILLAVLRRRIGPFDPAVPRALAKSLGATAIMAAVLLLIRGRLTAVTDPAGGRSPWQFAIFLYAVLLGLGTYLTAAWYLRSRELAELAARFGGPARRLGALAGRVAGLARRR